MRHLVLGRRTTIGQNRFCYNAAMKTNIMLAILLGAISAPVAAQNSDPNQVPEPAQTPDDITAYEKGDIPAPSRLPPPSQIPEHLSPPEKSLFQSAYQGDLPKVQGLVAKGVSVNTADMENRTPLILAAFNGRTGVVEFLLANGADVNAADKSGQTALIHACKRSFNETAALLLKNGADANFQTRKTGTTALMIAAVWDNVDLVRLLLDHGADADLTDFFGETAQALAQKKGNSAVVDLLSDRPEPADEPK